MNRLISLIFWFLGAIYLYPLYLVLFSSFKSAGDLAESPINLPKAWIIQNYVEVFHKAHYLRAFGNSLLTTVLALLLLTVVGSMAAYSIARWKSRIAGWLTVYFIFGLIAPIQLGIVPLYKMMRDIHLSGSLLGLSVLFAVSALPFSIFLWSGFIKGIPYELEEAAQIDGCSKFRVYWQIVFPLIKHATVTVLILNGIGFWNNFIFPLLFLSRPESQTLPLMIGNFVGVYGNDWPQIFAAVVLIETPAIILYLFAQKHIIKGMTVGAIKG